MPPHILHMAILKGRAALLHAFHLGQHRCSVQPLQALSLQLPAHGHRPGEIALLPLQRHQMPPHAVLQRLSAGNHPPDLLDGHAQLPQQFDLLQPPQLFLAVIPVAVFRIASGVQQPLLLIKADILFGNAHQRLYFIDFHGASPLSLPLV